MKPIRRSISHHRLDQSTLLSLALNHNVESCITPRLPLLTFPLFIFYTLGVIHALLRKAAYIPAVKTAYENASSAIVLNV